METYKTLKYLVYNIGRVPFLFNLGHHARRRLMPYVRAVNYHHTPLTDANLFEKHLMFYKREFANCSSEKLDQVLTGTLTGASKPLLLISFDDGFVDNFQVAADLLEKYGFTGWFFVSSGLIRDLPAEKAAKSVDELAAYMSKSELKQLIARGHIVGCHTHTHVRLTSHLTAQDYDKEIIASRAALQEYLDDPIRDFCWVGGEEAAYSPGGQRAIESAGYDRAFMTNLQVTTSKTHKLWIDRTNIETDWPLYRVKFYLSGIMDIPYARKRKRIERRLLK